MKGGTFLMGDFGPVHNADKLPYSGETNDDVLRRITLSDFSITAHKISVEQYDAFSDSTGRPGSALPRSMQASIERMRRHQPA